MDLLGAATVSASNSLYAQAKPNIDLREYGGLLGQSNKRCADYIIIYRALCARGNCLRCDSPNMDILIRALKGVRSKVRKTSAILDTCIWSKQLF